MNSSLKKIQDLPDHMRRVLAGVILFFAALALFAGWSRVTSLHLAAISDLPIAQEQTPPLLQNGEDRTLSPAAGVGESLKALKGFFPEASAGRKSYASAFFTKDTAGRIGSSLYSFFQSVEDRAVSALSYGYEKMQRKVEPQ
ncbi:MAG: hypothetical protein G01um101433_982 [Parcubacteria group bacterium Gr01-1014_33]|nr:MAG: hypothetical protein G01um101433_982 [Parcubacteria group bacterium Gr01-1014_33]